MSKKEAEKQPTSDPSPAKDSAFQKRLLDVAGDEDFNEIFPKLKAAEKNYLKSRPRNYLVSLNLIKLLIAIALLTLFIFLARQLFLSD